MTPFFSVIIAVYNKEKYIKATLESVLNQSFKDFDIIIVNDGSTDGSMEIISGFNDKRIQIINKKNEGVSIARNLGIQTAKADYVALLDADDIWYPNHLKELKYLIQNFPDCALYCSGYEKLYFSKKIVKSIFIGIDETFSGIIPDYFESSKINSIACSSSVAIPKSKFLKLGYFNVNLKSGEDTELWIRIALKEKIAFTSKITSRIVISDNGNHLSFSKNRIDHLEILKHFKESEKTNESLKKYMDANRFAVAIERKINGDYENFKCIIKDINYSNLNCKQKMILKFPALIINKIKQIQVFLIKNNIYLSPFR